MNWLAVKTRSGAVVPVLVLLIVALWFILRGDLFCVLILCCFVLVFFQSFWRCDCLAWGGLVLVLFVRLFDFYLFGFRAHRPIE